MFSLSILPLNISNVKAQEDTWTTLAPMPTPTTSPTSNPTLEILTSKSQNIESLILILRSITIIAIFSIDFLVYHKKYRTRRIT